jgi:CheY-like chemotaxis protein
MLSLDRLAAPTALPAEPFVLLVDDHETCLRQLRALVELRGHACVPASSAIDALVYCDARPPLAVVTDLSMPQLDGQGLARWLKARYPTVPIVLVTGQALDDEDRARLGATFAAVLHKPIDAEQFLELLEHLTLEGPEPAWAAECGRDP